ncbi:hypothetical protein [Nocardia pseudovaccinii]|uniref:hypothetical protein n=1 Tax=Nocardia pseudovaccinii TaxID=189540 RepID=UPI0027D7D863|nr:hypothetical protein [Nocardia pseudovaccinii]
MLAPIRRWVLYSRTNLVLTVAGIFLTLVVAGFFFGESSSTTTISTTNTTSSPSSEPVQPISYELVEVSEASVAGRSSQWVTSSAPAAAMAYAHTYLDQSMTNANWTSTLARYTATAPGESFTAARPQAPVAITGPTRSRLVTSEGGTRLAQVSIPTQAGQLQITLKVTTSPTGPKWLVDNPLPTLDLSQVAPRSGQPSTPRTGSGTTPASPSAPSTRPTPTSSTTTSSTPAPPSSQQPQPVPPPPGPIPAPDLDTPLPGSL